MPLKPNPRCSLCKHPKRQDIHEDRVVNHLSLEKIRVKYFDGRTKSAVARSIREHFKHHFNPDEEARIATVLVTSQPEGQPLTKSEERIFTAAIKERIQIARALEGMLRTLMERANVLEDEWRESVNKERPSGQEEITATTLIQASRIAHDNKRPEEGQPVTVGVDGLTKRIVVALRERNQGGDLATYMRDEKNLTRVVMVFGEIRKQLEALMDVKNPASVIEKLAERTFVSFVRAMTQVYLRVLGDRTNLAKDAINKYLAGESDGATLARDLAALDDRGITQLAAEADKQSGQILTTMLKDLR